MMLLEFCKSLDSLEPPREDLIIFSLGFALSMFYYIWIIHNFPKQHHNYTAL